MQWIQRIDHAQAQGLRLQLSGLSVRMERAGIAGLALAFEGPSPQQARTLSGAFAEELVLEGLEVTGHLAALGAGAPGPLKLDSIAGLEGRLRARISDAAWILDADVTMPVAAGAVDFGQVTVEHVGPNSTMGIGAGGLYVDPPHLARRYLYVFTGALPAGLDTQGRGRVELAPLLQDLAGRPESPGQFASEEVAATLGRTSLSGELHLADGALGMAAAFLQLAGQAAGRNRMSVLSQNLAGGVVLTLAELQASGSRFVGLGREGTTADVAADLHAEIEGCGGLLLRARRVQARELRWGDWRA